MTTSRPGTAVPRRRPDPDGPWPVVDHDGPLDRALLRDLLDNRVAAVRRRALLDPGQCAASVAALRADPAWDSYDVSSGTGAGKLGISQYAYGGRRDEYLADARRASDLRAGVVADLPDPLALLMAEIADVWDAPVERAAEQGRPYFAGVFRSGAGIRLHADWGPRDGPGWAIGDVVAQLAWNLYYAAPGRGGELLVHDRPWTPGLEAHARQELYDYDPATVAGCERRRISFDPGDVVLFSSSNVHAVADSPDGEVRLTASSFIGERPDGSLLFWS